MRSSAWGTLLLLSKRSGYCPLNLNSRKENGHLSKGTPCLSFKVLPFPQTVEEVLPRNGHSTSLPSIIMIMDGRGVRYHICRSPLSRKKSQDQAYVRRLSTSDKGHVELEIARRRMKRTDPSDQEGINFAVLGRYRQVSELIVRRTRSSEKTEAPNQSYLDQLD